MRAVLAAVALCAAFVAMPAAQAGPTDCGGAVDVGCDVCDGYMYRPGEPRECVSKSSCVAYARDIFTGEAWLCAG